MMKKDASGLIFICLVGIFIAALITCNLIANKFITIDLGFKVFVISAGILPYPITFLVTDILSELYGRRLTNQVVLSGFVASLFVLLFLWLGAQPHALDRVTISSSDETTLNSQMIDELSQHEMIDLRERSDFKAVFDISSDKLYSDKKMDEIIKKWSLISDLNYKVEPMKSPVDDSTYNMVFQNAWRVILASMLAYLCAQFLDVRLFHFWKNLTKGKHLWLRNNASTIASQLVDTTLVVFVLFAGVWSGGQILTVIVDGWIFKMLCALIDTPIIYGVLYFLRKKFNLKFGEELV